MELYSTRNPEVKVDFATAVFQALAPDGGLYMPVEMPRLEDWFWRKLPELSNPQIAVEIAAPFLNGTISAERQRAILHQAMDIRVPLRRLGDEMLVAELFHGPSFAFKDFGARFMAAVMDELLAAKNERLLILVATSGDTGGAVAAGFSQCKHAEVIILYPKGGVSDFQEAQLTTQGDRVHALRVNGSFDDCQALVKKAFLDQELRSQVRLSSANSINISRLIPQSIYYIAAYREWLVQGGEGKPSYVVPSGNLGNLTAGVFAAKMGLPVEHFVTGSNANDTVAIYGATGKYKPKASVPTLSNAMDVGAPSNFERLSHMFGDSWDSFRQNISSYSFSDERTRLEMQRVYQAYNYILDPHTAVGTLAAQKYREDKQSAEDLIVLATAHPGKFGEEVKSILRLDSKTQLLPEEITRQSRKVEEIDNDYQDLVKAIHQVWKG